MTSGFDSVLLVSFGGPEGPDDVMDFLERVTGGRDVPRARLEMVAQRYHSLGGISPINQANRDLLAALRTELDAAGINLALYWGNRNWDPLLDDTVADMARSGHKRALAIVTSAFGSYSGCRQYSEDIGRAEAAIGGAVEITKLRLYWNHPGFVSAMVDRIDDALARLAREARRSAHLVFTAHSIPTHWTNSAPYVSQLTAAAAHLASVCAPDLGWALAYQSRSGGPGTPWLEPDISDHLGQLHADGVRTVVVVPLGFVSDHMEVVYDLDMEAKAHADELGLTMVRAATVGTHPRFVAMLRQLIQEQVEGTPPLAVVGEPWPNPCPADCCRTDLNGVRHRH